MTNKPIRISLVEDRQNIRKGISNRIPHYKDMYLVSVYDNGEDALFGNKQKDLKGVGMDSPDLVIMDIGLPKMKGIECMVKIKAKYPEINFLMFTIFEDENVFEALKVGAVGYILKEDGINGVIEAIIEWKKGGAPMSRSIAKMVLDSFQLKSKTNKDLNEKLSKREIQVLSLLGEGLLYKEVGDRLNIKFGTVKQHVNKIYKKLQVNNKIEALKYLYPDK